MDDLHRLAPRTSKLERQISWRRSSSEKASRKAAMSKLPRRWTMTPSL